MKFRDPRTPDEWQEAVNSAAFWLLVDDARLYGLVTGGPDVDRQRCLNILRWGEAKGYAPRKAAAAAHRRTPEKSEG